MSLRRITRAGIFIFLPLFFITICFAKPTRVRVKRVRKGFVLRVDNKPFIVKGVCYNPVPVGEGPYFNFLSFPGYSPWEKDAPLMKEMGINVIRLYDIPSESIEDARKVIRYFYENYGIYTVVSDWLGFWVYPGPFYADKDFREKYKDKVLSIVKALKDEPGVLMWILGNENNYSFRGSIQPWSSEEIDKIKDPQLQIKRRAEIYYSFVEDLSLIHI